MLNFLQEFINTHSNLFFSEFSPSQVIISVIFSYILFESFISYDKSSSTNILIKDLDRKDFLFNFYYEIPHYYNDYVVNKIVFYNILLARGINRRIYQSLSDYHKQTLYDLGTYNKYFDYTLNKTHFIIEYNYPSFIKTYFELKQYILYNELYSVLGSNFEVNFCKWYILPDYIWVPPEFINNVSWLGV